MTDEQVLSRIDDIEALVNGLIIFLAAKEAGVDPNIDDEKFKEFLRSHPMREMKYRLQKTGALAADGYHEAVAIARVDQMIAALKKDL